jgi:hypothetical protein
VIHSFIHPCGGGSELSGSVQFRICISRGQTDTLDDHSSNAGSTCASAAPDGARGPCGSMCVHVVHTLGPLQSASPKPSASTVTYSVTARVSLPVPEPRTTTVTTVRSSTAWVASWCSFASINRTIRVPTPIEMQWWDGCARRDGAAEDATQQPTPKDTHRKCGILRANCNIRTSPLKTSHQILAQLQEKTVQTKLLFHCPGPPHCQEQGRRPWMFSKAY